MRLVANFLTFQLGWFSCVLGAAHGLPWLGPLVVLAVVFLHLFLSSRPMHELRLIAAAMMLGLMIDSLLLASGWLQYPNGAWLAGFAPYWIVAMWALFATTLNVSMRWLRGRTGLAALLGSIGGPLSYVAGQKMGAISFPEPTYALMALSATWGLAMPLLTTLAAHFDGEKADLRPDYVQADWRGSDHV